MSTFRIQIDYKQLPRNLKDCPSNEAVKKAGDMLNKELNSKQETLERIQTPNMKVSDCFFFFK